MPGWMGLQALAGTGSYAEAFLEPAWTDDEPINDFTQTDLLWWRPVESNYLKKDVVYGFMVRSMYHMHCERCDTKWEADVESVPRCWFCGRFVRLNKNFKEERRRLRDA